MKTKKILTIVFGLVFFIAALWASGEPDETASSQVIIISNVVSIVICAISALLLIKLNPEERSNEH